MQRNIQKLLWEGEDLTGVVKVPDVDMPAGGRKKQLMYLPKASILSDKQL